MIEDSKDPAQKKIVESGGSMNGDSKVSTKKKIVVSIIVFVFAALAITAVVMFAPDPMPVDWSKAEFIPSNVTLLAAGAQNNPFLDNVALVRYKEDGTIDDSDWKILQFTDMHLTQNDKTNKVTLDNFIATLKREKPDFVALTGDIITRPLGRARAVQLAEIFEKMNVYWCYCLGNHEGDSAPYTLTREENIRIWAKYPHCLVENDVKTTSDGTEVWGLGNTIIDLLGADYKIRQTLVFMDSGNEMSDEDRAALVSEEVELSGEKTYDFLKPSQMNWYKEKLDTLEEGVKSMVFIHIPLVQQGNVKLIKASEPLPQGWHYAYPEEPLMLGEELYGYTIVNDDWNLVGDTASYEKCYCSEYDSGMYEKYMLANRSKVNALFCGHDHVSNSILYQTPPEGKNAVYLCYGVCSGLQSYNMYSLGVSDTDDYSLRGYSIINVKADSSFDLYHVRYNNVKNKIARILSGVACD